MTDLIDMSDDSLLVACESASLLELVIERRRDKNNFTAL
jgi:hypothetical protein